MKDLGNLGIDKRVKGLNGYYPERLIAPAFANHVGGNPVNNERAMICNLQDVVA